LKHRVDAGEVGVLDVGVGVVRAPMQAFGQLAGRCDLDAGFGGVGDVAIVHRRIGGQRRATPMTVSLSWLIRLVQSWSNTRTPNLAMVKSWS